MANVDARITITADSRPAEREIERLGNQIARVQRSAFIPVDDLIRVGSVQKSIQTINQLENAVVSLRSQIRSISAPGGGGGLGDALGDSIRVAATAANNFFDSLASGQRSLSNTISGLREQSNAFAALAANISSADARFTDYVQGAQAAQDKGLRPLFNQFRALQRLYEEGITGRGVEITSGEVGANLFERLSREIPQTEGALKAFSAELQRVRSLISSESTSALGIEQLMLQTEQQLLQIEEDRLQVRAAISRELSAPVQASLSRAEGAGPNPFGISGEQINDSLNQRAEQYQQNLEEIARVTQSLASMEGKRYDPLGISDQQINAGLNERASQLVQQRDELGSLQQVLSAMEGKKYDPLNISDQQINAGLNERASLYQRQAKELADLQVILGAMQGRKVDPLGISDEQVNATLNQRADIFEKQTRDMEALQGALGSLESKRVNWATALGINEADIAADGAQRLTREWERLQAEADGIAAKAPEAAAALRSFKFESLSESADSYTRALLNQQRTLDEYTNAANRAASAAKELGYGGELPALRPAGFTNQDVRIKNLTDDQVKSADIVADYERKAEMLINDLEIGNIQRQLDAELDSIQVTLDARKKAGDAWWNKEKALLDQKTAIQDQQARQAQLPFLERVTGNKRVSSAISEGLIGGAFPLLFGQGAGAAVLGGAGGAVGGFAGGGLGFGLSLIGTAAGTAIDEAEKLDKQLAKVNASAKGVGSTSADVNRLASSLGIAKEEAVTLLAQFKQFGSAQIRKDLALVFGGGREAILERLESIVKEEDVLQAIAAARKEIGNEEATSLLNTFKIEGSARAQLVLREALLRISEKEVIEEKKRIGLLDRAAQFNPFSILLSGPDLTKPVDPAVFGKKRAADQQKIFDEEREQRRKNYDTAIKDSQKFFKLLGEESPSGKGSKDALGSNLLSAIDTRNEAIDNARKQREQQIADIRKQAIEAAARIEEDLADKRKRIEREIQDVRLNRADSAIDADIRFRELRGEDAGVIEAERELLAISREDRDARIELQRRLGDEESEQAKTIAEFQKGVAKQIQDANLASFRAIGEIQSNYAKQVAKIIEEGSNKGAKRLETAARLYSFYAERGGMNQARSVAGATIIPEPVMRNNQLDYQEVPAGAVTPRFRELDQKIYDLQKQLQSSRRPDIGQQFTALLGAEGGFEDIAGLKPLPIQKMYQQIGRPFTQLYERIQRETQGVWEMTRREAGKILAPNPKRTETVLKRAERVETVRQNWKPLEAQSKELLNRTNPAPRSKPALMTIEGFREMMEQIKNVNSQDYRNHIGVNQQSAFVSDKQFEMIKKGVADLMKGGVDTLRMWDPEFNKVINEAIDLENRKIKGDKWVPRGPSPMEGWDRKGPLRDKRDPWVERFMQQTEPPQITPGIQNRIEGASLPGTGFDVSKVATDFGTIAAASILRGVLDDPEVSGASGSMQIAQAYNVKEGNRVGYYPPRPQKANAPAISGAAATTQARKDLAAETLAALDDKRFASLKNYFAEVNAEGLAVNKNLIEQNKLLNAQLLLMGSGVEAGLARQLVETENTYAARLKQLEGKREDALKKEKGWDVSVVEGFYNAELELLRKTNDEIKNRTTEYAKQSEFLLAIASLNQQIAVTGAAEEAGFFGAGANAYTSELARSGDPGQATEMAQQTRALEVKQAVAGIRGELNSLTDPMNQVIGAANAIGGAFSESFKGVISGSMSAKEALASFFRSTADYFLDMAAQIIQKWIVMTVLNQVVKLFPGGGGLSSLSAPATINNPLGDLGSIGGAYAKGGMFGDSITPFANGGAFTNSIVSSPTLFRFADGGVTKMGEMGEAGPEAIMPLKRGPDGRLGVSGFGGGGGVSVVVNVDAKGSSVEGSDQGANQLGRVISAAVQSELIKQKRPGGILAR